MKKANSIGQNSLNCKSYLVHTLTAATPQSTSDPLTHYLLFQITYSLGQAQI